ncbi:MAG: tRNA (5-methylaminomethyl-2-thiouridine)(34)-methyltransferase MnmD [Bacteroidales bacterium]|nr:tRNA (5-methylaminomethyl-2-thiouridine)(34)-methyltransferase MnmD [Bacteroidales bacterium]
MRRKVIISEDGSKTLTLEDFQESYHSIHGALSESLHIFIREGLNYYISKNPERSKISILEAGLGTGLNCLLTAIELTNYPMTKRVNYITVEKFPVTMDEAELLNYPALFPGNNEAEEIYKTIHGSNWNSTTEISDRMNIVKIDNSFEDEFPKLSDNSIDIVYYDAFSPETQPELWSDVIFRDIYRALKPGGILVTYSSKGIVKRALRESGFEVKRLQGPKGKKHIVRAEKPLTKL